MNQIIVYQTNYSGLFVGESLADESPLEFNNETAGVIRLAQSFNDVTATTELAETVTFIESAWEVSLPNKDATGQQTLQFQICNVTGEAQRFIDDCLKSGKQETL